MVIKGNDSLPFMSVYRYFSLILSLRFQDGLNFLNKMNIKTYNYTQACVNNEPTRRTLEVFEMKICRCRATDSSDLLENKTISTKKVAAPCKVAIKCNFGSETSHTESQTNELAEFRKKNKVLRNRSNI